MKIYSVLRTVIYFALTAVVLFSVSVLAEIGMLRYFIGGLMIFYGAEEIIITAIKNKKHYSVNSLYWNIFEIILGITLVAFVEEGEADVTYAIVCVCWAIWSIFRETRELTEATEELRENKLVACRIIAVFSLIESLVVIAMSLTMITEPGEHHAKVHLYLLAVELFTKVLFPLINNLTERAAEKKNRHSEETADVHPEPEETENEVAEDEVAATETETQDLKTAETEPVN